MPDLSGMLGPIDDALAQGAPPPSAASPYQRTIDGIDAALFDGLAASGSPRPLVIGHGPTYGHTLAALDAVLNAPAGTPIIPGAAPVVPAGLRRPAPRLYSDAELGLAPAKAADALVPAARPGQRLYSDADLGLSYPPKAAEAPTPAASRSERLPSDEDLGLAPAPSAAPQPASGPLSNAPGDGWLAGAAKGAGTALIKGAGDAVGFVGGAGNFVDYLMARGQAAVTGQTVEQAQADLAARRAKAEAAMSQTALGRLASASDPTKVLPSPDDVSGPILQRTGAYQPTSEVGRMAQAGVEAVPAMLGPGGGMASPGAAGRALAGQFARSAPAMALGGAASQGAVDATGNPLAGLGAGLAAPALGSAAGAAARGAARLAAPIAAGSSVLNAAPVIGPALRAGREAAVAGKLLGQSSDPAALRAWAASPADAREVTGSPRTLAGAVGDDPGLSQAEKDARNVNNSRPTPTVTVDGRTYGGQSFNGIDAAQSVAQVAALGSGQPGADVFRPGAMIRQRMDAIDAAAKDAEDRLTAAHADAVSRIADAGQAFAADQQSGLAQRTADRLQAGADFAEDQRSGLADRTAARVQAAADDRAQALQDRDDAHQQLVQGFADVRARQLATAQDAASGLGQPVDDDALGGTLRGAVEQVRAGQKDLHRDLYKAVDPDGTLALVATPVADRAGAIAGALQGNGGELTAAEAPLFRRAAALPDVATYGTLHQLDTDLSAAMSAERRTAGESPAWARLTQLKGSIKDAMSNAVDNQAQHEARMVDAGAMAPEDTIAARLQQKFDAAIPAPISPEAGRATGTADGYPPTARASDDPSQPGTRPPQGSGPGAPAGGAGLQADAGRAGQAAPQGLNPADLEARTFRQSVPAEPGHRVVPVDADKVDVLTGWQPDYRIAPGQGGANGKLARASDFVSGLQDGQEFRPPVLGVHDQGMGFDDGRHRFAAMRDLGFKTVPVSMDAASEAAARRLGLVTKAPAREVGAGPRPDAPAFDPDGPLRAPPRPTAPRPQDLRAFVKERGGIIDTGGDLASMGLQDLVARGGRGASADRMREAAAEAGYLGADTARAVRETHPNDLLDALSGDAPVHSVHDEDAAADWAAYDDAKERYAAARGEFGTRSTFGVRREPAPLSAYSNDDIAGPGGPQVPEPPRSGLQPSFDPAAEGRLKAANAAYAEYARTYKNPIVGPGLRTTGFSGQYQRSDAGFIKGAIRPGPEGYEHARAFLQAAKNDPEAVGAMHDAALNPLRRAALGPGFVPPRALANWKESYGPALRALDEVTPGFSSRFDDAGRATQALLDMGSEHEAAIGAARKEAARQAVIDDAARRAQLGQANAADRATVSGLLAERAANDRAATQADRASTSSAVSGRAASDRAAVAQSRAEMAAGLGQARAIRRAADATPAAQFAAKGGTGVASEEVENAVGGLLKTGTSGATRMRSLVQSVGDDPEALAGLRKAGTDWLVRTHTSADGTLSGAKLIGFLRDNAATLRELYPHDQFSMMGAVARDAEAGARWRTATAIKGGSDSVKNLLAAAAEGHGPSSHVTLGMVAVEAIAQGYEHGGLEGAAYGGAGAAALYVANTLRQAGIRRASDLYMAALTDPELARTLISKMPTTTDSGKLVAFSRSLRRAALLGPMAVGEEREADRRRRAGAR